MALLFTPSLINKALGTQRDVKLKTLAPPSSPPRLLESDKGGWGREAGGGRRSHPQMSVPLMSTCTRGTKVSVSASVWF